DPTGWAQLTMDLGADPFTEDVSETDVRVITATDPDELLRAFREEVQRHRSGSARTTRVVLTLGNSELAFAADDDRCAAEQVWLDTLARQARTTSSVLGLQTPAAQAADPPELGEQRERVDELLGGVAARLAEMPDEFSLAGAQLPATVRLRDQ